MTPAERAAERTAHIRWARVPILQAVLLDVPAWYHALPTVGQGNPRADFLCGAPGALYATARTAKVNAGDACPKCMRIVAALARKPQP